MIGVIGAGVMGCGLAQNLAEHGYEVALIDQNAEILRDAKDRIARNLRLGNLLYPKPGRDFQDISDRIHGYVSCLVLKDADVVVENVPEKWEVKKGVYEELSRICKETCMFLVNTSCISITRIATLVKKPERVIGVHFMNPVPLKHTVEVIRGYHTSDGTLEATMEFLKTIEKDGIVVNDLPGFVSNRISHLFMNEAAWVVQDQVAEPKDVDDIFKKCFGHTMGPLETADFIGLDVVLDSLNILYESYKDDKFRPCPLLCKMVHAGLTGVKGGKGFYEYSGKEKQKNGRDKGKNQGISG
ncbi:MAG: 3-hydroxyacyl-CoA dehydrogenase family protein [Clostridium sp.]|jgi:3-hydroxybutyryl-CoA dehydrogenase|nr:3-hydroxyacyl-CoA dehydrogenase family protein [Clostridium sp.]